MTEATPAAPRGADFILARLGDMGRDEPWNGWRSGAAIRSSAEMLLRQYEGARCDDEGVSHCIRCNTVYLAKTALDLLEHAAIAKAEGWE